MRGRSGSRRRGICLASSPGEMCEACNGSALLGGSPAGRGRARSKGDGWRRADSCAGLSRDAECSLMRRGLVFTLRRLQDPGAGVYLDALEISRRDEISKCSTCLKMRGIPRGWARARGYKSSTPCTWCGDREGGAGPARANRTLGRT